ncbi:hypothetical protein QBC35DRAFT_504598 [Podospora australis]|uniref:C2H2-type domain-containing protein n=1 Tax=Podospora australis TaxID=1536484 RepID=A0AAN6WNS8_9PEZI|nr:hypothetical protein QBC35DRAFT_504598 [Podospora australis]
MSCRTYTVSAAKLTCNRGSFRPFNMSSSKSADMTSPKAGEGRQSAGSIPIRQLYWQINNRLGGARTNPTSSSSSSITGTNGGLQSQKRLSVTTLHFSCPFYALDRNKHHTCLSGPALTSLDAVRQHLEEAHRRPYQCPVCNTTFESISAMNYHIRQRSCNLQPLQEAEGLSEAQIDQLIQWQPQPGVGEEELWLELCEIVLPDARTGISVACVSSEPKPHWLVSADSPAGHQ